MRRDFSVGAYNEILRLISKIESGPGTGITNWYGSGWYEYASWIDSLGIRTHISNVNSYHNTVVARNIAAKNSVDATFNAVGEVDVAYGKVLANINTNLSQWFDYINQLAQIANPKNDRFTSSNMSSSLDGLLKNIEQGKAQCAEDMLVVAVGEELVFNEVLVEEYLNSFPPEIKEEERLAALLSKVQNTLIDAIPNIGTKGEVKIPIGPGLTFYYKIDASLDNNSDFDVNLEIEDQQAKLDSVELKLAENEQGQTIGLEASDEEVGFSIGGKNGEMEINYNEEGYWGIEAADASNGVHAGFSMSESGDGSFDISGDSEKGSVKVSVTTSGVATVTNSIKDGDYTYTSKVIVGIDKVAVEESIKMQKDDISITTTMGLEKKRTEGNNYNWAYVGMPQYTFEERAQIGNELMGIPSFDFNFDWEQAGYYYVKGLEPIADFAESLNPDTGDELDGFLGDIYSWICDLIYD